MKWPFLLALGALALWPLPARTEHARIDLRVIRLDVKTGQNRDEVSAAADVEPPLGGLNPRPLFKVKAAEPLALQFVLTNTYPHGVKKGVTVRYFVAREAKLRQKTLPDLTRGVVTQGEFTMDFKPGCRVGARVLFTIKQPGAYLIRVETLNTDSDHEHFSAIDLQVE
jgi:hypothetical protein